MSQLPLRRQCARSDQTHQPVPCRTRVGRRSCRVRDTVHAHTRKSTEVQRSSVVPALTTRREQLAILGALCGLTLVPGNALAGDATDASTPASKAVEAIRRDFVERQYYVTGDVSRDLFASDCVFIDPTVKVTGVDPYVQALQTLFDPAKSRADLLSLGVTGPNTVALRWRLEGSLKLGGLRIKPYTGTTVYTVADNGKVVRHEETWDISTVDAFVSTFLPGFGAPPAPPVAPAPSP